MNDTTKKAITAAMLAAIICVATMAIKVPSPTKGYINLGDCAVLLSGWLLSPPYGFFASGIGSALADIFAGYAIYAPATFFIKGVMALAAYFGFKVMCKKMGTVISRVLSGALAEIIMILGYFVFEGLLYGFGTSVVNISINAVQGSAGIIIGMLLVGMFKRNKII